MIIKIKGPNQSGKSFIASALRNNAIANGCGALIIDTPQISENVGALLEKLLVGAKLPENVDGIDGLPWKKDPVVILVGDVADDALSILERSAPGFTGKFGPIFEVTTNLVPQSEVVDGRKKK